MKNGIVDKLSTYAALIGVIATIGGGFYAWGEFNTRLSAIEGSSIDISGITTNTAEIAKSNERISLLEKSESEAPDVSGIKKNETNIAVAQKEIEVLKLQIQELKLKAQNPLANSWPKERRGKRTNNPR